MDSHDALKHLKVALVHDALTVPGGAEKVLNELHQLFPNAPIYTPLYLPERFPEYKDAKVIPSPINRFSYLRNHHQIAFPLLPYAVEQFDLTEYDLVISDSSAAAKGILTRPETIHICYCHTPMRWAWMPQLDPRASSSWIRRLSAHYLRIWDAATVNRVDHWLANSHTTADRIRKFYNRESKVIYPPVAVDKNEVETKDGDYYLSVGRLVGQKRIDILIDAAIATQSKLKIIGDGPLKPEMIKRARGSNNIELLGRVDDATRNKLYAECRAFLFAAEEDAGIVPIEAMGFGKPVICYGRGGASETVIDGKTGLHFSHQSTDSLVAAIRQLESMSFDNQAIISHSEQFSPEKFREALMAEIHSIVSHKPENT
jgi:glycosyltransferase involved in cell wall biosynthesis